MTTLQRVGHGLVTAKIVCFRTTKRERVRYSVETVSLVRQNRNFSSRFATKQRVLGSGVTHSSTCLTVQDQTRPVRTANREDSVRLAVRVRVTGIATRRTARLGRVYCPVILRERPLNFMASSVQPTTCQQHDLLTVT